MESLRASFAGAGATSGNSDGQDAGGEKFQYRWVAQGRNLAEGKPYAASTPSKEN